MGCWSRCCSRARRNGHRNVDGTRREVSRNRKTTQPHIRRRPAKTHACTPVTPWGQDGGTLDMVRKCEHGIYLPKGSHTRSPYCGLCTPFGSVKNTREVVLPMHGIGHPHKLRANGRNGGDCCPQCGSQIYMQTTERSRVVDCADCGERYRRKRETRGGQ